MYGSYSPIAVLISNPLALRVSLNSTKSICLEGSISPFSLQNSMITTFILSSTCFLKVDLVSADTDVNLVNAYKKGLRSKYEGGLNISSSLSSFFDFLFVFFYYLLGLFNYRAFYSSSFLLAQSFQCPSPFIYPLGSPKYSSASKSIYNGLIVMHSKSLNSFGNSRNSCDGQNTLYSLNHVLIKFVTTSLFNVLACSSLVK